MPSIADTIDEFLAAKRQEGRSAATIVQYRWHLNRLAEHLAALGVHQLDHITRAQLRHYAADLLDAYAPATVRVAVVATHSYLHWCQLETYLTSDLSKALRYPRVPLRQQRTLSRDDITALLSLCDANPDARSLRDAAIVATLIDSGIRRAELVRLTLPDLNIDAGRLRVTRKGGDQSYAYIGAATAIRIGRWLSVRPTVVHPGIHHLYVAVGGARPGHPITPEGLRSILRRLGDAAGVQDVSPHAFRRAFATLRLENGDSTRAVQALGGWKKIDMVERYSQAIDLSRLARQNAPMDELDRPISLQLPLFGDAPS